jgi:hypothetical protein
VAALEYFDREATSDTIGQMDAVQARIGEVLEEQATIAHTLEA